MRRAWRGVESLTSRLSQFRFKIRIISVRVLFGVNFKRDFKTSGGACQFSCHSDLDTTKLNLTATRSCCSNSTELEFAAKVKTIVITGTFAVGLKGRLLGCRWPWLLTAIWERNFADVKPYGILRNKVSNNLGAAPGNPVSVRSNGVRR